VEHHRRWQRVPSRLVDAHRQPRDPSANFDSSVVSRLQADLAGPAKAGHYEEIDDQAFENGV